MESIFSKDKEEELGLNELSINHLKETGKWGKFLAIVQFVTIALFVIIALILGIILPELNSAMMQASPQLGPNFYLILYLILAAIMVFPALKLYYYSVKLQRAIQEKNSDVLMEAFKNQKQLYAYSGIITVISIAINALALTLGFFAGMMSSL